jgi:hypothetical protein
MFARIARFKGGQDTDIDAETRDMRKDIEAFRRGEEGTYMPELSRLVNRLEILADRQNGTVAAIVYCETEAQLREADRILNAMSPRNADWGERVSVDTYEVVLDERTSVRRVA